MVKRLLMAAAAAALVVGLAGPAGATGDGGHEPEKKCNSGRGNGQETTVENDCDPGNSEGHNSGGG
jgi:hypothetical protein